MNTTKQELANNSYFEIRPVSGWVTAADGSTLPPTFTDMKDGMVRISFAARFGSQTDAVISYDKLEDILRASLQDKTKRVEWTSVEN